MAMTAADELRASRRSGGAAGLISTPLAPPARPDAAARKRRPPRPPVCPELARHAAAARPAPQPLRASPHGFPGSHGPREPLVNADRLRPRNGTHEVLSSGSRQSPTRRLAESSELTRSNETIGIWSTRDHRGLQCLDASGVASVIVVDEAEPTRWVGAADPMQSASRGGTAGGACFGILPSRKEKVAVNLAIVVGGYRPIILWVPWRSVVYWPCPRRHSFSIDFEKNGDELGRNISGAPLP